MAESGDGLVRIERAIYVVSSLVFLLLAVRTLAIVGLDAYDRLTGLPLPADIHTWVGWTVAILIGILEIGAGLFLAFLALRAHRRIHTSPT